MSNQGGHSYVFFAYFAYGMGVARNAAMTKPRCCQAENRSGYWKLAVGKFQVIIVFASSEESVGH
jgi:hypothetical protein